MTAEVDSNEWLISYVAVPAPSVQETRLVQDVQQSIRVTANEPVERENHLVASSSAVTSKVRPALELLEQQSLVTSQHQLVQQLSHVMSSIRQSPLDIKRPAEQTAKASRRQLAATLCPSL